MAEKITVTRAERPAPSKNGLGLLAEIWRENRLGKDSNYESTIVTDEVEILYNRLLYMDGRVDPSLVGKPDLIRELLGSDEYEDPGHVVHFQTYDRLARADEPNPHGFEHALAVAKLLSWPEATAKDFRIPLNEIDKDVAAYLESLAPGKIAEMGGLRRLDGASFVTVLEVYREMFAYAEREGIECFIAALEPAAWPKTKRLFGDSVRMMHKPDKFVHPPLNNYNDDIGIILDASPGAYDHFVDYTFSRKKVSDWLEEATGASPDKFDPTDRGSLVEQLVRRVSGLLIINNFGQRVNAFDKKLAFFGGARDT